MVRDCAKCEEARDASGFPPRSKTCALCKSARARKYNARPEVIERTRAYHKARPRDPVKERRISKKSWFNTRYGLTLEEIDAMIARQNGFCAICGEVPRADAKGRVFRVDHDHGTGSVRDLLCNGCNRGLGFFSDCAARLRKAAEYLETHAAKRADKAV